MAFGSKIAHLHIHLEDKMDLIKLKGVVCCCFVSHCSSDYDLVFSINHLVLCERGMTAIGDQCRSSRQKLVLCLLLQSLNLFAQRQIVHKDWVLFI